MGSFIWKFAKKHGLPQAGRLANSLLKERIEPFGHYEFKHTSGIFNQFLIQFNFSSWWIILELSVLGGEHSDHMFSTLQKWHKLKTDCEGELYCGIALKQNHDEQCLDISMLGNVKKIVSHFKHNNPNVQFCLHQPTHGNAVRNHRPTTRWHQPNTVQRQGNASNWLLAWFCTVPMWSISLDWPA